MYLLGFILNGAYVDASEIGLEIYPTAAFRL